MHRPSQLLRLAERIDRVRLNFELDALDPASPIDLGTASCLLLRTAFPAFSNAAPRDPMGVFLADQDFRESRTTSDLQEALSRSTDGREGSQFQAELRRFAARERARIAMREILPREMGGADVDVTSAELSMLADVTISAALREAESVVSKQKGVPVRADGQPSRMVVLGMGKLGGNELNCGSDVDLIYFYDTDAGQVLLPDGSVSSATIQEYWTRVARRMTHTLEDHSEEGIVWRVDLRLRPEGGSGPIVTSFASAELYYESFGRLWERAALLRARPVGGDLEAGEALLLSLAPFVWRRKVDPTIANEMTSLVRRARAELSDEPERDLKLGEGGIREAEFFVQTLALIWGGKEPAVRARGTLDALSRLGARGLLTDREGVGLFDAYLALRRTEHAVQWASGVQTHSLPADPDDLARIARVLGFDEAAQLESELSRHRSFVHSVFASLVPEDQQFPPRWPKAIAALDANDLAAFEAAIDRVLPPHLRTAEARTDAPQIAVSLFELTRHPDALFGARTRETFPLLAEVVLDAVIGAADPALAAHFLRSFSARVRFPAVYVRYLGENPQGVRRLVAVLGASAYAGEAFCSNPEFGDLVLFNRDPPTAESARAEIEGAFRSLEVDDGQDPEERLGGELRRAKARITLQAVLADLSGDIALGELTDVLSSLAEATLEQTTHFALRREQAGAADGWHGAVGSSVDRGKGFAVIAMGKLGGHEIGYGSDLDVIFIYDPQAAPVGREPARHFSRVARTIIRMISSPHQAGPGYELDTRLRPSGNQGMLVSSFEAFSRYHGAWVDGVDDVAPESTVRRAATWERMALLRARAVAGDRQLGQRVEGVARQAAYRVAVSPNEVRAEISRIRKRLEDEASSERTGRYDLKFGVGGLLDIEFCVQLLQMLHAEPSRVCTTQTSEAILALTNDGTLTPSQAEALDEGYQFLRGLEQRIRIVHADASHLLDENDPGLESLARRMDFHELPGDEPVRQQLVGRYLEVTRRVRQAYDEIVGTDQPLGPPATGAL